MADELQKISQSEAYKRLSECIGDHKYLPLIKLALRIEKLSEKGKAESIAKIRDEVFNNPKYGVFGVRVLNMGSTGTLLGVIQYISDSKIKFNLNQTDTQRIFEEIIKDWTLITIFHKYAHGMKMLSDKIINYMDIPREIFFVFASGGASIQAKKVIANLSNNKEIRNRGYMVTLYSKKEDLTGRELYSWVFQKFS